MRHEPSGGLTSRRVIGAGALVVGALVCYLGVAQGVAGLMQARGRLAVEAVLSGAKALPPEELASAIADYEEADQWWPDSENALDIGTLAVVPTTTGARVIADQNPVAAARREYERSLVRAPGSAAAWARLASVLFVQQGASRATVDALMMSIRRARVEPTLYPWRCRVGLSIFRALDGAERRALFDQIRLFAHGPQDAILDLASIAYTTGTAMIVTAALSGDRDSLEKLSERLDRFR